MEGGEQGSGEEEILRKWVEVCAGRWKGGGALTWRVPCDVSSADCQTHSTDHTGTAGQVHAAVNDICK